MSYIQDLSSPDGLRGMFNILLTATILTIFEIVFFYKIVVPGVNNSMNNGIENATQYFADNINQYINDLKKSTTDNQNIIISEILTTIKNKENIFFKTFSSREYLLTNKINYYTKLTGGIIIMILVSLLFVIYYNLKRKTNGATQLTPAIITSLITVFLLISFQIMFYFFSLNYNYPGSEGSNELLYTMIEGIDINQNGKVKSD